MHVNAWWNICVELSIIFRCSDRWRLQPHLVDISTDIKYYRFRIELDQFAWPHKMIAHATFYHTATSNEHYMVTIRCFRQHHELTAAIMMMQRNLDGDSVCLILRLVFFDQNTNLVVIVLVLVLKSKFSKCDPIWPMQWCLPVLGWIKLGVALMKSGKR